MDRAKTEYYINIHKLSQIQLIFTTRHIAHGIGALVGLILTCMPVEPWKGRRGWSG